MSNSQPAVSDATSIYAFVDTTEEEREARARALSDEHHNELTAITQKTLDFMTKDLIPMITQMEVDKK